MVAAKGEKRSRIFSGIRARGIEALRHFIELLRSARSLDRVPRKTSKDRAPQVALIIETSKIYGRELLLGINQYVRLHGPWSIFASERGQNDEDPPWLANWDGDGIITRSVDLKNCRRAKARGLAVVSLRHLVDRPEFPTLFPDQELIARRMADHFLERGFRHFAYAGVEGEKGWELLRRETFVKILKARGVQTLEVKPFLAAADASWDEAEERIAAWVKTLPTPVAIAVNHDTQGIQILDACRRIGARVPEDVAVASVDNDPVLCELATPPLSSLNQNVQRLGYEAAAMLDRMMHGEKVAAKNTFFEPGHMVVRQSSDVVALQDARLSRAVRHIREKACSGIDVAAVAKVAGLSRRSLEKKFTSVFGRTPLEEIQEVRLRRVRQLLLETDLRLPEIAEMAGFQYQEYMVRFFKQRTGLAPGQFRRQSRFG